MKLSRRGMFGLGAGAVVSGIGGGGSYPAMQQFPQSPGYDYKDTPSTKYQLVDGPNKDILKQEAHQLRQWATGVFTGNEFDYVYTNNRHQLQENNIQALKSLSEAGRCYIRIERTLERERVSMIEYAKTHLDYVMQQLKKLDPLGIFT